MNISTTRIAGQDRYDTSLQIAKLIGVSKGAFITTGLNFPDALSAAPIAAAQGMPILLVPPNGLTAAEQTYLNSTKVPNYYVLNGNNELSSNLVSQLPNPTVISGSTRYDRNVNLVKQFAGKLNLNSIYAATGADYPDALAASVLAAKNKAPLILVPADTLPSSATAFLGSNLVTQINIIGGTGAVNGQIESQLQSAVDQIASISDITATGVDKQKYQMPTTVTATLTDGSQVQVPVTWTLSSVNTGQAVSGINNALSAPSTYIYSGTVQGYSGTVTLTLTINPSQTTVRFNPLTAEAVQGYSYTFPTSVTGRLSDNSVQVYPVTWNVSSSNFSLQNVGSYSFQGTVSGVSQKVTLTLKVVADTPINIPDANLLSAIRYQLTGLTYGNTLYLSDALKLTKLVATSKYISNLSGLENFQNLTDLELSYNSITTAGLAPVKKLTNLQVLVLNNNNIDNFSALSALNNLQSLYVQNNATTNYAPLKGIYNNLVYRDFTV